MPQLRSVFGLFPSRRRKSLEECPPHKYPDLQASQEHYEYEEQLSCLDELAKREKALEKCRTMMRDGDFGII
jgi:hypothetical protein